MINIRFSEEEKRELHHQRYYHPHPRVRQKMEVLWLKSQEFQHQEISLAAGVSNKTLVTYLRQYEQGGVERLKELRFYQPRSAMTLHRTAIEAYFRDHPPATAKEAAAKIAELTGITRSTNQIRLFLKRCGMRWRVTGVLPAKADPVKQEYFKKHTLEPLLEKAKAGKHAVFFVDAAHFVFGAFLSALWCFTRAWIKAPYGRQRFNVLGAINATTHEVITITNTDYINSTSVCALLYRIKALNLAIPVSLVMDNARYQCCKRVKDLAQTLNIELVFLPSYSPNLNLIERLWKFVKKQCLYGKYYPTFDAFTNSIQACLSQTQTTHFKALQSLLAFNFQTFEISKEQRCQI